MINLIYIPTRPKLKQEQILTDPGYNFGIYSGCALILKNVFHSWFTLSPLGFFIGGRGVYSGFAFGVHLRTEVWSRPVLYFTVLPRPVSPTPCIFHMNMKRLLSKVHF